jgi:polar amino acid transport system substrate-binding protein
MAKKYLQRAVLVATVFFVVACGTTRNTTDVEDASVEPLRVGITSDYPPLIFRVGKLEDKIVGIEADLARQLAKELNRSVRFVEMPWEYQIPSLLAGKTDIIMSGMTVTDARKVRIYFTEPYLKTGLSVLMRSEDLPAYESSKGQWQGFMNIGVQKGTTGDVYVQQHFPNINKVPLLEIRDAPIELRRRSIDLFVHDTPAIMWLVSANEGDFSALKLPSPEQWYAWGISRDNSELITSVNRILANWRANGTLDQILKRWIPNLQTVE